MFLSKINTNKTRIFRLCDDALAFNQPLVALIPSYYDDKNTSYRLIPLCSSLHVYTKTSRWSFWGCFWAPVLWACVHVNSSVTLTRELDALISTRKNCNSIKVTFLPPKCDKTKMWWPDTKIVILPSCVRQTRLQTKINEQKYSPAHCNLSLGKQSNADLAQSWGCIFTCDLIPPRPPVMCSPHQVKNLQFILKIPLLTVEKVCELLLRRDNYTSRFIT